ncbi:hypothetical protein SDC9_139890 [bioreactor metagenome]|uniref:Uncharacterized protein n=1 Tax=bioreactor metagenome TaxID=1076179 RepID=A0A645DTC9_9ZZZZ
MTPGHFVGNNPNRILNFHHIANLCFPDWLAMIFVQFHHFGQQFIYTFVAMTNGGLNRNSKHFAQLSVIEIITFCQQLIMHIQCNDDRNIKLQQLCCQKKISFKIGRVNNIDDKIRRR